MSYKRVVKKKGKSYGPYVYESYRDSDGKVKKRYLGKAPKKNDKLLGMNSFVIGVLAILLLSVVGYSTDFFLNEGKFSSGFGELVVDTYGSITGLVVDDAPSDSGSNPNSGKDKGSSGPSSNSDSGGGDKSSSSSGESSSSESSSSSDVDSSKDSNSNPSQGSSSPKNNQGGSPESSSVSGADSSSESESESVDSVTGDSDDDQEGSSSEVEESSEDSTDEIVDEEVSGEEDSENSNDESLEDLTNDSVNDNSSEDSPELVNETLNETEDLLDNETKDLTNETLIPDLTNETLIPDLVNETTNETGSFLENETSEILEVENETEEESGVVGGVVINETIANLTNGSLLNITLNETLLNETIANLTNETLLNLTNQTFLNETNLTLEIYNSSNVTVLQYKAVIGRPVKWLKKVNVSVDDDLVVTLPKNSTNISILTGSEIDNALDDLDDYDDLVKEVDKEEIISGGLTGNVISSQDSEKGFFSLIWDWIVSFTISGNVISEEDLSEPAVEVNDSLSLNLSEVAEVGEEVAVEYYTPGPVADEVNLSNGKRIVVYSEDEYNYTEVLAYSTLVDGQVKMNDSRLKIYWYEGEVGPTDSERVERLKRNGSLKEGVIVPFKNYDLDSDGYIDYIEWVVPHLSAQVYEIIIEASDAEHLDSNRNRVSNIYDEISSLDGNWSEPILDSEFVRVTFEKNLTYDRDITIYARSNGTANLNVYEGGENISIATFENISRESLETIYLVNLEDVQDTFDLQVFGDAVEFDWIVDPLGPPRIEFAPSTTAAGPVGADYIFVNLTTSDDSDPHYAFTDFDKDVLLWLRMDEVSAVAEGATVYDNSTYGNDGTAYGNAIQTDDGSFGNGYTFDGTSDGINLGDFDLVNNFTINMWVNSSDNTGDDVLAKSGSYYIRYGSSGTSWYYRPYGTTETSTHCLTVDAAAGNWHMLTVVSNSTHQSVYHDGAHCLTEPSTGELTQNDNVLALGDFVNDYNGSLDEVMIFDRPLSSEEISSLYNASANQYEHVYPSLVGTHNFTGYAVDVLGNVNLTEMRTTTVGNDTTPPQIQFAPTTDNDSVIGNSIFVNLTTNDESLHYSFVDFDSDLLLWLRMDYTNQSGTGALVYDNSSYGRDGVAYGAAVQNESGLFAKSYSFDGDGDYVNVDSYTDFDFSNDISIGAWIKQTDAVGNTDAFIETFPVYLYTNGETLALRYRNSTEGLVYIINYYAIPAGEWHHVFATITGENISLYLDGSYIDSALRNGAPAATSYFRVSDNSASVGWNGSVDEVVVFNRSLDSQEIAAIYNSSANSFENTYENLSEGTHNFTGYVVDSWGNSNLTEERSVDLALPVPVVSYDREVLVDGGYTSDRFIELNLSVSGSGLENITYQFNDSNYTFYDDSLKLLMNFDNLSALGENSTYAVDVSLYGNNGTWSGGQDSDSGWTSSGKYGGAYNFDASDHFDLGNPSSLQITNEISVAAWFKKTTADHGFIVSKTDTVNDCYRLSQLDKIYFSIVDSGAYYSAGSTDNYNDGQWHQVVGTYDGNYVRIYVDGFEAGTPKQHLAGDIDNDAVNVYIGKRVDGALGYNGSIDEVMIWNRSLSVAEIRKLYFTNLHKYDSQNWTLYANISQSSTQGLVQGTYDIGGSASNNYNVLTSASVREITLDNSSPQVSFAPTSTLGDTTGDSIFINLTTSDSADHYSFVDFDSDLLFWMRGDNYNSTHVLDNSSYGNDGALEGDTYISNNGYFGKGMVFDGDNDSITIPHFANFSEDISVSGWFKADNNDLNKYIFRSQTSLGGISIYKQTSGGDDLRFYLHNGSSGVVLDGVTHNINDGNWHFFTAIKNETNYMWLYLDDEPAVSIQGPTGFIDTQPSQDCRVGHYSAIDSYSWNGTLDEVMIFNRVLSDSEISSLYNSTVSSYENTFSGLSGGSHSFTGYAVDLAGNVGGASNTTSTSSISECTNIANPGSYALIGDLSSTGTTCISVNTNGVTIDLMGHNISDGVAGEGLEYGINISNYNNVKIFNGTISGFGLGVYAENSYSNNFSSLSIDALDSDSDGVAYGIYLNGGGSTNVENCNLSAVASGGDGTAYGIYLSNSEDNLLSGNSIYSTEAGVCSGAEISSSDNNTFFENSIYSNTKSGISLTSSTLNNISSNNFTSNDVSDYGARAIKLTSSYQNDIENNVMISNPSGGFSLSGSYQNTFSNNNIWNTSKADFSAIYLSTSDNNTFSGIVNLSVDHGIEITETCGGNNVSLDFYQSTLEDAYILGNNTGFSGSFSSSYGALVETEGAYVSLIEDLSSSSGAFNFSANEVVLDLNGFNLSGSSSNSGVYVKDYNSTKVVDGYIHGFDNGVYLLNSYSGNLDNVTIYSEDSSNSKAVYFQNGGSHVVSNCDLSAKTTSAGDTETYGVVITSGSLNQILDNGIHDLIGQTYATGVYIDSSSQQNTISGNSIHDSEYYGVTIHGDKNYFYENNVSQNNLWDSGHSAIYVAGEYNEISNNTLENNLGGGFRFASSSHNIIFNNTLSDTGFCQGAISISNSHNNSFSYSSVQGTNGSSVYFTSNSENNTFDEVSFTGSNGNGINLAGGNYNNFTGVNVSDSVNNGVYLSSSSFNRFSGMTIDNATNGFNASSADNSFLNNVFSTVDLDYVLSNGQDEYSFNGNSLEVYSPSAGSIRFLDESLVASGNDLGAVILVSDNSFFVNSTLDDSFNTSANVTVLGVNLDEPTVYVDQDDDGNYEGKCTESDGCYNLSYDGTDFVFNVSHFTTYRSGESSEIFDCQELNISNYRYELSADVETTGTCFTVTASNVTLDCNGHKVNYSSAGASGYGISDAGGYDLLGVTNCTIVEGKLGTDNKHAIYLSGAGSAVITDNDITTLDRGSFGVYVISGSGGSIIANNTIDTTGYETHAIHLNVPDDNNVTGNNLTTSGTGAAGVRLTNTANDNRIEENNIVTTGQDAYGVYLYSSSTNTFRNNKVNTSLSSAYLVYGTSSANYNHDIDTSNLAEGLPIVYNYSITDTVLYSDTDLSGTYGELICAYCDNVTYDNVTMSNDGIGLYYTANSSVLDSSINTSKGMGIHVYQNSDLNTLSGNEINVSADYVEGIMIEGGSDNNVIEDTLIRTEGYYSYGMRMDSSVGMNTSNMSIQTFDQGGTGIYLFRSEDNYFIDLDVLTSGRSARGAYFFDDILNNIFVNTNLTTIHSIDAEGIYAYFDIVDVSFTDSVINSANEQDVYVHTSNDPGSTINFTNVSFDETETSINNANVDVNVFWYMDVNVSNSTSVMEGVNVTGENKFSSLIFNASTGAEGTIPRKTLRSYFQDSSGRTEYSNYTINASKSGYTTNSTSINLTTNYDLDLKLGISNFAPDKPVANISFSGETNTTSENITCTTLTSDADGDILNLTFRWYLNGSLNTEINYSNIANNTLYSAVLLFGNTTKHENWSCDVRFKDGSGFGEWSDNSGNVTVLNSLPNVTLSSPGNNSAIEDRTPMLIWSGYDADGDSLTYDLNVVDYKFSGLYVCDDDTSVSDTSDENYTFPTPLTCLHDNGYQYLWSVRAFDGEGYGEWAGNYSFNVTANVTIELTVDEVLFNSLGIYDSNDTLDDNPAPLVIENKGNSLVNVSVNSTALFDKATDTSAYFRFKVDNEAGEEGAFEFINSLTDWTNVPITGSVLAISKLNYTDVNDSAEVDIYVDVPDDEPAGQKSATVLFTSSLGE